MSTPARRRKSTTLSGQDAVAPTSIAPAPEPASKGGATHPAFDEAPATSVQKPRTKETRKRLQVQMDTEDLAELRTAYTRIAGRGETLSDFVAGIITARIRQYRDEINDGRPFEGPGTVVRGRPPKY